MIGLVKLVKFVRYPTAHRRGLFRIPVVRLARTEAERQPNDPELTETLQATPRP